MFRDRELVGGDALSRTLNLSLEEGRLKMQEFYLRGKSTYFSLKKFASFEFIFAIRDGSKIGKRS